MIEELEPRPPADLRTPDDKAYFEQISPPARMMTAMIIVPVIMSRTPALAPKVLSMVTTRYMKSAALQMPGTLALPPATEVPPITTTAGKS